MTSTLRSIHGLHVAVIMDGNGRWATARGMPRTAGHRAGAEAVRRVTEAAPGLGITTLTLFAFSGDNWRRPQDEVHALFALFEEHLRGELGRCLANGVRLTVIGRRDRLPLTLRAAIAAAERATAQGSTLDLRLAVDYSARHSILQAAQRSRRGPALTPERFAECLGTATHMGGASPDVDLLIRSGGERRLSDFLLWECVYAELFFTDRLWPEFGAPDLAGAVEDFCRRERRFGAIPREQGESLPHRGVANQ